MLLLLAASVNVLAATSIVAAPSAVGVNVAVYTVLDVAAKSLKVPLVTVISSSAKLVVASLDVKISGKVASLVVEPLATGTRVVAIFLIRLFKISATYTLPLKSTATPEGELNDAAVPVPFAEPDEPLPANVVTTPAAVIFLIR